MWPNLSGEMEVKVGGVLPGGNVRRSDRSLDRFNLHNFEVYV